MTLARSFTEEAVTDGTRTVGTIKGLNPGFRLFLERLGRVDITGTLADARRLLLDMDKVVAGIGVRIDQHRAELEELLDRNELAMEGGHGPGVPPAILNGARERVEAGEALLDILKGETREEFWRRQVAEMSVTWEGMKAEGDAA